MNKTPKKKQGKKSGVNFRMWPEYHAAITQYKQARGLKTWAEAHRLLITEACNAYGITIQAPKQISKNQLSVSFDVIDT